MQLKYLRNKKQSAFKEFVNRLNHKQNLSINTYSDVCLYPLGQIVSPINRHTDYFVDDNDFTTECRHSCSNEFPIITGRTLYGGWLRKVWGHFLMGSLARLWTLTNQDLVEDIDHFLFFSDDFPHNLLGNYLEVFQLLGIADKVIILDNPVNIEHLIVPEISFEHDRFYSDQCRNLFDYIRLSALGQEDSDGELFDKIFLTRSALKGATSDEVNIRKLDKLFSDNGFKVIYPEKISLKHLINMIEHASEIASLAGSTAHNLIFDKPDSSRKHIIIERHPRPNSFQLNIDTMMGFQTTYIDGFYLPNFACSSNKTILFAFTKELNAYTCDNDWNTAAFDGLNNFRCRRKELSQYYNRYRNQFSFSETIADWEIEYAPLIAEAVIETNKHYSEWLIKHLPLFWFDYISPRFIYRFLKSLFR